MTETIDEVRTHVVYPEVPEGQVALSLCGETWTPTSFGIDAALAHPVCVDCTVIALGLLREADAAEQVVIEQVGDLAQQFVTLIETLDNVTPLLDQVKIDGRFFIEEQEAIAARAAEAHAALLDAGRPAILNEEDEAARKEAKRVRKETIRFFTDVVGMEKSEAKKAAKAALALGM